MGSSGGSSDDLAGLLMASREATPMPGLPVAGKDSTIGDPYAYGKFQNFLPVTQASGANPSATGLEPEMFQYTTPSGGTDPEVQSLRNELAQLKASSAAAAAPANSSQNAFHAMLRAQMSPQDLAIFRSMVPPENFEAFMNA